MKHTCILSILLLILCIPIASADEAAEILAQADSVFAIESMYQKSSMEIFKGSKAQPVQIMESFHLKEGGVAHTLTVFLAPKRIEGTAYLTVGDDLWVRFASTGRVRKLSSSSRENAAGGSDFSYADMGEEHDGYAYRVSARIIGSTTVDRQECRSIEMIPTDEHQYEKIIAAVTKDTNRYLRLELYDNGIHIKTMHLSDYRRVGDIFYPFTISMESMIGDSRTVITTIEIEPGSSKVKKNMFRTTYLKSLR